MMKMVKEAETFKWWILENFSWEELEEMARGGSQVELKDFIKKIDVESAYRRFNHGLWAEMAADAAIVGRSLTRYLGFVLECYDVHDDYSFKAALLWYVAQEAARELVEWRAKLRRMGPALTGCGDR